MSLSHLWHDRCSWWDWVEDGRRGLRRRVVVERLPFDSRRGHRPSASLCLLACRLALALPLGSSSFLSFLAAGRRLLGAAVIASFSRGAHLVSAGARRAFLWLPLARRCAAGHAKIQAMRAPSVVHVVLLSAFLASAVLVGMDASAQSRGRPWLGVAMDSDSPAPGRGAWVGHVVRGSPAARAGLREGDRLTRIARTDIFRSADVVRAVSALAVGDAVEVSFLRADKDQSAQVTLAAFPSPNELMRMDLVGTFAPTWKDVEAVNGVFPDTISALHGRVLVLDFFASWCAPCRVLAPKLGSLQSRYGAQGLAVLGVSTEDAEEVALFARQTGMRYAVGADRRGETTRAYGVASLPTVVIIDRRGVVRDVSIGYDLSEEARIESLVQKLLAEPLPAQ